MSDLQTLQARILEADRAQRDIEFDQQELAEALQNAAAEPWTSTLSKSEKVVAAVYSVAISEMRLRHVREVAELERRLREATDLYLNLLAKRSG